MNDRKGKQQHRGGAAHQDERPHCPPVIPQHAIDEVDHQSRPFMLLAASEVAQIRYPVIEDHVVLPARRTRFLRVREVHLRDHIAPLVTRGAAGTAKVDLLLRGMANRDAEDADPGQIPSELSWEYLHDTVRPREDYRDSGAVLKRKWLGDKLEQLESMGLLRRVTTRGRRSKIVLLRDDGSQLPNDDPGSTGDSYVTVLGGLFESQRITGWGTPQVAAYFDAMIAERYARADPAMAHLQAGQPLGGGRWFRALDWFADENGLRPADHIRIPFSARTLRRGMNMPRAEHLITSLRVHEDPRTGQPFRAPYGRYIYSNAFADLRRGRSRLRLWTVQPPPRGLRDSRPHAAEHTPRRRANLTPAVGDVFARAPSAVGCDRRHDHACPTRTGRHSSLSAVSTVDRSITLLTRHILLRRVMPEVQSGRADTAGPDAARTFIASNARGQRRVEQQGHGPSGGQSLKLASTTRLPEGMRWSNQVPSFGNPAGGTKQLGPLARRR